MHVDWLDFQARSNMNDPHLVIIDEIFEHDFAVRICIISSWPR